MEYGINPDNECFKSHIWLLKHAVANTVKMYKGTLNPIFGC